VQQKADLALRPGRDVRPLRAAQIAGRTTEQCKEGFVEPADAAEPCGEGDLGHRKVRFVNQLFGEQNAAGLSDRERRCAKMLAEEVPELTLANAKAAGQGIGGSLVQGTELDQRQGARHGVRRAAPRSEIGRGFRAAPQAGAKASLLCRRRRGIECDVLRPWRARRADRTAIDARRLDAGEEPAVKAGIAQADCAVGVVIEVHRDIVMGRRGIV
jgi:hypothetical protein